MLNSTATVVTAPIVVVAVDVLQVKSKTAMATVALITGSVMAIAMMVHMSGMEFQFTSTVLNLTATAVIALVAMVVEQQALAASI